jgi:hypothetical protein
MRLKSSSYAVFIGVWACIGCGPTPGGPGGNSGGPDAMASAYAALTAGDLKKISEAIRNVDARFTAAPDDGHAAFYGLLMRTWLITEGVSGGVAGLEATLQAPPLLERAQQAYDLLPDDPRVPGFAGMMTALFGQVLGDEPLRKKGRDWLDESVRRFPGYGYFMRAAGLHLYPTGSPEMTQSAADLTAVMKGCKSEPDAAGVYPYVKGPVEAERRLCNNDGMAPHLWEGLLINYGDVLLKSGAGAARARGAYASVKNSPTYADWPFARELEERIAQADERAARYADANPLNDPVPWFLDGKICRGCHQRSR